MNLAFDRFLLHAYIDDELTPDEVKDVERRLAHDPDARAEVAALRAQKHALHARYDALLDALAPAVVPHRMAALGPSRRTATRFALAASLVVTTGVGLAVGWIAHGHADQRAALAMASGSAGPNPAAPDAERRLQAFVRVASVSHAVFVPEVRHPVEVGAADEAHLVAWLSKRLDTPLVVPHLGDAGWDLLGGRLLPAAAGPVAQFMYQDRSGRRLTLAVSRTVAAAVDAPRTAFRIAEEDGNTVFYWIDGGDAYALTGRLSRGEMTAIAERVDRQLDR